MKTISSDLWPQGNRIWSNGYCSAFAEALKSLFGGELWAIVNHSRKYPEPENDVLLHAYCVIDGLAYDDEGPHPLSEFTDLSNIKIPEMDRHNDAVIQWKPVTSEWFEACHEDYCGGMTMLPQAIAYIRRNPRSFGKLKEIQVN